MEIDELYSSLLVRHFKNETTETEKQQLFKWVYAKPTNEKLYYSLKDVWETSDYNRISEQSNTDKEWEKLVEKVFKQEQNKLIIQKQAIRKVYRVIQIAAVLVITLGIGFFIQKIIPQKQTYTTVVVPYGAKSQLELADGSKVWVNSGSKLTYPDHLNKKEVDLYLEGEAFFDIVKNTGRKLNVKTSTLSIQVLGTAFNVKSYEDEDEVEATLVRGSISVYGKVGNSSIEAPVLLKPNQQIKLIKSSKTAKINDVFEDTGKKPGLGPDSLRNKTLKTAAPKILPYLQIAEKVDVSEFTSWKDNKLMFKNEQFVSLAKKLERWYNIEVIINEEALKNKRYTGTFENETMGQAMKALSLSLPFNYTIDKNKVYISKN